MEQKVSLGLVKARMHKRRVVTMKVLFKQMKLHYYVMTFAVVAVLFFIEDARPSHVLEHILKNGLLGLK